MVRNQFQVAMNRLSDRRSPVLFLACENCSLRIRTRCPEYCVLAGRSRMCRVRYRLRHRLSPRTSLRPARPGNRRPPQQRLREGRQRRTTVKRLPERWLRYRRLHVLAPQQSPWPWRGRPAIPRRRWSTPRRRFPPRQKSPPTIRWSGDCGHDRHSGIVRVNQKTSVLVMNSWMVLRLLWLRKILCSIE